MDLNSKEGGSEVGLQQRLGQFGQNREREFFFLFFFIKQIFKGISKSILNPFKF